MTIEEAVWELDEYGVWNFHHNGVHAFIQKRPGYCDRGHYSFNVDGIPYMDGADSFPRYYMTLANAVQEATMWLNWRLYKSHVHPAVRYPVDNNAVKDYT